MKWPAISTYRMNNTHNTSSSNIQAILSSLFWDNAPLLMTNLQTQISQEDLKRPWDLTLLSRAQCAAQLRCSCSVLGRDCRRTLHLGEGRKMRGSRVTSSWSEHKDKGGRAALTVGNVNTKRAHNQWQHKVSNADVRLNKTQRHYCEWKYDRCSTQVIPPAFYCFS